MNNQVRNIFINTFITNVLQCIHQSRDIQLLLQSIGHAESNQELLVKGLNSLFVDRPVQYTAGTQHSSAEEERTRELVVVDVLQEDQNHGVSAGFNDLVKCLMGCKPV